jgi:hypothetical protein
MNDQIVRDGKIISTTEIVRLCRLLADWKRRGGAPTPLEEMPDIFGVAIRAANRLEKQEQALKAIAFAKPECCQISNAMQSIARKALEGKDE